MFDLTTLTDYSDQAVLEEIRRVSNKFDGAVLTQEKFNSASKVHSSTVAKRFGGWAKALQLAGLDRRLISQRPLLQKEDFLSAIRTFFATHSRSPSGSEICEILCLTKRSGYQKFGDWKTLLAEAGLKPMPLGRRYTETECLENILKLWTHFGRQPNFAELKSPPSEVGPKAYIRRYGGWRNALLAFVTQVNAESPALEVEATDLAGHMENKPSSDSTTNAAEPKSISLSLRYKTLVSDRFRCRICGRSPSTNTAIELHIDHIFPRSKGGRNVQENLRTLCSDCNLGKGDKIEEAFG